MGKTGRQVLSWLGSFSFFSAENVRNRGLFDAFFTCWGTISDEIYVLYLFFGAALFHYEAFEIASRF
jgi:hypothetical protein